MNSCTKGSDNKPTMFLFDLDGTVTECESLPRVASVLGLGDEIADLTELAVGGREPFADNFRRRVAMLSRFPVDRIAAIMATTPLRPILSRFIAENPGRCAIVTSNLQCWCAPLARQLGCPLHASTASTADGYITGEIIVVDKAAVVAEYQKRGHRVAMIGDGANDIEAMRRADLAIAFGPSLAPFPAGCHAAATESELFDRLKRWS